MLPLRGLRRTCFDNDILSFDTLLLVDLADHFEDGNEGGTRIAAKEGILVGIGDDDCDVVGDGFFVPDPFFGRGVFLFEDAFLEADAGEGELVIITLGRHGLEFGFIFLGDVARVEAVFEVIGVAGLAAAGSFGRWIGQGVLLLCRGETEEPQVEGSGYRPII